MYDYSLSNTESVCVWQDAGQVWLQCDHRKERATVRMTSQAAKQIANTLLALADAMDAAKK